MTIWDGRGELGFEFRLNLNLWTNPSWTKLELKWPTQCCSAQTPGEIVWFFLQKHLHWKLRLALMQFLPFLFEKTKGIWKTAHPCITCTEVYHIFLSASDWTQCSFASDIAGTSASPASPASPGHKAPTRLRLTSGSGWPTSNFDPRINWAQWCPQKSLLAQTPWQTNPETLMPHEMHSQHVSSLSVDKPQ